MAIQYTSRRLDKRAVQALKRFVKEYKKRNKKDISMSTAILILVNNKVEFTGVEKVNHSVC